jgi:hypothetical protein
MPTTKTMALTLLVLLAAGTPSLAEDEPAVRRVYPIQYLGQEQVRLVLEEEIPALLDNTLNVRMAWEQLPRRPEESDAPRGYLRLLAPESIQGQVAAVLEEIDVPPPTLLFQVTLLRASKESGEQPDLPRAAASALRDLEGFLPFKSYAVIDAGMIRTSAWGRLELSETWKALFRFRSHRQHEKPLTMESFELTRTWPTPEGNVTREVIETTFSMNVGETLVVGTSKLDGGDEALVVLLTVTE